MRLRKYIALMISIAFYFGCNRPETKDPGIDQGNNNESIADNISLNSDRVGPGTEPDNTDTLASGMDEEYFFKSKYPPYYVGEDGKIVNMANLQIELDKYGRKKCAAYIPNGFYIIYDIIKDCLEPLGEYVISDYEMHEQSFNDPDNVYNCVSGGVGRSGLTLFIKAPGEDENISVTVIIYWHEDENKVEDEILLGRYYPYELPYEKCKFMPEKCYIYDRSASRMFYREKYYYEIATCYRNFGYFLSINYKNDKSYERMKEIIIELNDCMKSSSDKYYENK